MLLHRPCQLYYISHGMRNRPIFLVGENMVACLFSRELISSNVSFKLIFDELSCWSSFIYFAGVLWLFGSRIYFQILKEKFLRIHKLPKWSLNLHIICPIQEIQKRWNCAVRWDTYDEKISRFVWGGAYAHASLLVK